MLPGATLPAYVVIEPACFGAAENDQHPPQDVLRGDALIGRVYNALPDNAALFEGTLLAVLYDEHGGFYDHAPPPPTVAPDGNTLSFAFDTLGVGAVLVSPWLDPGVTASVFDDTSLLRMAADLWPGVRPLGALLGHQQALLGFSEYLQSLLPDGPVKQALMARARGVRRQFGPIGAGGGPTRGLRGGARGVAPPALQAWPPSR